MDKISQIKFAYLKYYSYLCAQSQSIAESELKESINNTHRSMRLYARHLRMPLSTAT